MKNFTCTVLLLLFCTFLFSQEEGPQNLDEINSRIEKLLNDAEASVNKMDFDQALGELNFSLELSKKIDHKKYIALTGSILAKLYYIRHDYSRATSELNHAISIQKEINDLTGLAYSYVSFAKLLNSQNEYEEANNYLDLARDIYEAQQNTEALGLVALNRGIIKLNLQESREALELFKSGEVLLKGSDNIYEQSRLIYYRARAYAALGQLEKAETEAGKALRLAEEHQLLGMVMYAYGLLSHIYEKNNDLPASLAALRASDHFRDSIFSMNKEALALEANTRFGLDALRSSVDELTQQNAEQEHSLKVNKLTTILSVALITILSLLTLSLYKNNNLRARANDLLQKKNNELTLAKENAEKASLAKAQFLSTITHELRTPLYAVTGLTHLLLEESPTENQKEHLNSLKFSGEYLLSLINNILDLNKLEANKVEIVETSFNLQKRISDVLIALKNSADEKNTKLHFTFGEDIPKRLKGDPLKISQILINLIGNSIKFTEDGDIWIKVEKKEQKDLDVTLHFEIRDNGEGISKEKQKAIFENFTQGSTQINRKFGGTGLGLSIVKNLLNLMGSEIQLESEISKGSRFSFDLSFEALEIAPAKIRQNRPEGAVSSEVLKNKRILVVEDNKINQMITRKILQKHEVICEVADNGTTAIEKVKKEGFDLILMDIHMPGISGIEATVEIRKFNNEIPIVALTAVTLDESLDEFYLNGFTDIIPKPYKTEEFFNKIKKHIAAREPVV